MVWFCCWIILFIHAIMNVRLDLGISFPDPSLYKKDDVNWTLLDLSEKIYILNFVPQVILPEFSLRVEICKFQYLWIFYAVCTRKSDIFFVRMEKPVVVFIFSLIGFMPQFCAAVQYVTCRRPIKRNLLDSYK